jgi:hypothetical protein
VLYGEWTEQWGRDAAQILLRNNPETDAIFCGSDQLGRGVSDTLRALGRRIPEDVALIGFDNWQPMALGAQPPLASVDMCLEDVGRIAAEHLLSAIGGEPTHGAQAVPCRLVLRESAGTAPDLSGPAAAASAGSAGNSGAPLIAPASGSAAAGPAVTPASGAANSAVRAASAPPADTGLPGSALPPGGTRLGPGQQAG